MRPPTPPAGQPFVRTLRSQWLGQQLRTLREQRGFTLTDVAATTGRPPGLWDRFEKADWPIARGDITALLDLYRVHDTGVRERLLTVADQAWRLHHWDTGDPPNQHDETDASFITLDWLTSRAAQIQVFTPSLTVDLLPATSDAAVPVELVIAETALQPRPGDPLVHQLGVGQLVHLASLPHAQAHVLPGPAGRWADLGGFVIFRRAPYPPVAYQHGLAGRLYLEGPAADRFIGVYRQLRAATYDLVTSRELINDATARRSG